MTNWRCVSWFLPTDKPYIRLLPQLSPRLAHQGLSVEVNEGEDLELSVLIEAYPHIIEHRWHTPTSPNTSTQEHKFIRYNNRYTTPQPELLESKVKWKRLCNRPTALFQFQKQSSVLQEGEATVEKMLLLHFGWIWQGTSRSLYFRGSWNCC